MEVYPTPKRVRFSNTIPSMISLNWFLTLRSYHVFGSYVIKPLDRRKRRTETILSYSFFLSFQQCIRVVREKIVFWNNFLYSLYDLLSSYSIRSIKYHNNKNYFFSISNSYILFINRASLVKSLKSPLA